MSGWLDAPRGLRRAALGIYLLAAMVRLTLVFGFGLYEIGRPEPVRIAISLARSGTFADPYVIPTGPTAHVPPFYPWLIAPIYRLWGDTRSADLVRIGFSAATGSAEYALLPYVSASLGMGALTGVTAGLAGAVLPVHHWQESQGDFETAWTAVFLQLSVIGLARWMRAPRVSVAAGTRAGLWCGWGLLLSPNVVPVLGGLCAVAMAAWRPRMRVETIRALAAFGLAAGVMVLPWTIRNHAVIGGWFPIRDNFGLELSTSNCEGASSDSVASSRVESIRRRHPGMSVAAAAELKRQGELAFVRDAQRDAMAWIRSHPLEFARLSAGRIRNFWFPASLPRPNQVVVWAISIAGWGGLIALLGANRFAGAVLGVVLATYPAIYYLLKNNLRYQHPVYWVLLLLGVYLALRVTGLIQARREPLPDGRSAVGELLNRAV